MSFLLKIVEGPNKGAEAALVDGVAVTLGKGDECDIVLADPSMPDSPIKIETSADGVAVDGELLEPLHVMTIGDTSFAIGPAERAWGKLVWPASEEAGEKPTEAPAVAEETAPKEEPPSKDAKKPHGCLVSIVVLAILAGILAGFAWYYREWLMPKMEPYRPQAKAAWGWTKGNAKTAYGWCRDRYQGLSGKLDQADEAVEPERDPAELIAEIASRYGLDVSDDDGGIAITGNLKTRAERLSATAEAYAAMPLVELNLSDDETLKTTVEDTLTLIGENDLRVRAVTNRVAVLDGKCSDFSVVVMRLSQEVPKLTHIDSSAVHRTASPVATVADNGPAAITRPVARPETPKLPVCGILTTPYPCLVTRSGARIMEGATFGEWTVKKIGSDSVELENATGRLVWRP